MGSVFTASHLTPLEPDWARTPQAGRLNYRFQCSDVKQICEVFNRACGRQTNELYSKLLSHRSSGITGDYHAMTEFGGAVGVVWYQIKRSRQRIYRVSITTVRDPNFSFKMSASFDLQIKLVMPDYRSGQDEEITVIHPTDATTIDGFTVFTLPPMASATSTAARYAIKHPLTNATTSTRYEPTPSTTTYVKYKEPYYEKKLIQLHNPQAHTHAVHTGVYLHSPDDVVSEDLVFTHAIFAHERYPRGYRDYYRSMLLRRVGWKFDLEQSTKFVKLVANVTKTVLAASDDYQTRETNINDPDRVLRILAAHVEKRKNDDDVWSTMIKHASFARFKDISNVVKL